MTYSQKIELNADMYLMKKMSFIGTMQKIFGVLFVITGALFCLGIITAIIGIPYIFCGIKMFKSGSAFSYAAYNSDGRFLRQALLELAEYWKWILISIILTIVFYIILFIFIMSAYFSHY